MNSGTAQSSEKVELPVLLKAINLLESQLSLTQRMHARIGFSNVALASYTPGREIKYAIRHVSDEELLCVHLHDEGKSVSMTCTCTGNSPSASCIHKVIVTCQMAVELRNPESALSQLLYHGSAEAANRHIALKLIKSLNSSVSARSAQIIDAGNEGVVATDVRYRWNLKSIKSPRGADTICIRPAIQKSLRSGEWGKPREISLKTFLDADADVLTATDTAMYDHVARGQIHVDNVSYFPEMLDILTDTEVVTFDLEPCQLERGTMELIVLDAGDCYRIITSSDEYEASILDRGCKCLCVIQGPIVLFWNQTDGIARWYRLHQKETRLIQHLVSTDFTIPKSEWPAMMKELFILSGTLPVRFPPSVNIQQRNVEPSFALLLRFKRGLFLHAVICLRDGESNLIRPGDGQLIRNCEEDGQNVQYIRNAFHEQKLAGELRAEFRQSSELIDGLYTWKISSESEVVEFLEKAAELSAANRLTVIWHKGSSAKLDVVGRISANNVRVKIERQRDWFGVNGSCTVGNQTFTLQQLLESMQKSSTMGLIELTPGRWASITDDLKQAIRSLADSATSQRGKLKIDATAAITLSDFDNSGLQIDADKHWQKCLERIRSLKDFQPELPAGLKCQLREYQLEGYQWLCRLAEWGVGGILADDMGLGKTVQTLAVLLRRRKTGPALVIAPLSLGFNWVNETQRFAPSLKPLLLRDADRDELLENAKAGQVIICSYGLALREAERLGKVSWGTLVLDEAQNIKNSNSQTANAVKSISAEWKIALTGTPIENHLGELWSIFSAVAPGVLGSWEQFRNRFASPIEKDSSVERRESLRRLISPFVLRRTKAKVLNDLPDRNEMNLLVDLSAAEREVYDRMRVAAVAELNQVEGSTTNSGEQRLRILQILTRLRQLACHVGLVDSQWSGSSSKLELLLEKLTELKEGGHRALIFSQFTSHLEFIRIACEENGFSYLYLDGQTPAKQRQLSVEAFQGGQADVFLISLKAGGTGLNLTAADYVIHMDPWWNPAVEDQASDRAHRIGQTKNVMVYRIISRNTIEEQILNIHGEKRDLVDSVLLGADSSARLSTVELADLIRSGGNL